ncbi:MAG: hypothetical protein ABI759_13885 [Candidatus Solibacter sp.]
MGVPLLNWLRFATLALLGAASALAQVAILQIRVVEGEGAVHIPGARGNRPITVEITEETGKPVGGTAVTFHLPEDGPSGAFVNGLRTEVLVSDTHGRATLHGFTANRISGRFQLRILASKEQARAGTVSFQYIAEPRSGVAVAAKAPAARKLWVALAVAVAGGAVATLAVAHNGSAAPPAPIPAAPVPPILTIGAPTISVGKP